MKRVQKQVFYLVGSLWLVSGCGAPPVEVSEVFSHGYCQNIKNDVASIKFADLAKIRGGRLLLSPGEKNKPDTTPLNASSGQASTNESMSTLYSIYAGAKPTGGYALQLHHTEFSNTELNIHIRWQQPDPDAMVTQAISRPCTVIQVNNKPPNTKLTFWLDEKRLLIRP